VESLAQDFLALAHWFTGHIRSGTKSPRKSVARPCASRPSVLIWASAYQSRLEWMSQHHLFYLLNLAQQIVNAAPVPARFHHHFALAIQAREKLIETKSSVAIYPTSLQLPASLI